MKENKKINKNIYSALLEYYSKDIKENNTDLSEPENEFINFVLGENIDESAGTEILNRFMSVFNSGKKKVITAAVIATLMANPAFSAAMETAPDNIKNQITQITGDVQKDTVKNKMGGEKEIAGNYKSKESLFTINFYNNFNSGSYDINSEEVYTKLERLKDYLNKHKNNRFKINIIASESQVPNQSGFKIGELANKRAQVMDHLVSTYIAKNKLGEIDIHLDTNIGDVTWDGGDKNDKKYIKDQYVVLEVLGSSISPCEISFSEKGKQASSDNNYIAYKQELEGNGSLTMTTGTIPDRMQIVQDGQVIGDTDYFVDKKNEYEQWKYVPIYVTSLTELLINNPSEPVISGTKLIKHFENYNELLEFMLVGKDISYDMNVDTRTEIKVGIGKLSNLWKNGQRDFVFYKTRKGILSFNIEQGKEAYVQIFSPLGQTGFSLKGNCE